MPTFFIISLILISFVTSSSDLRAEEQKPKYGPDAIPLSMSPGYFKDHFPSLFWKIIPYYVQQQNKWSCGVASSIMVLNAARAILNITPHLKADQPLFNEDDYIQFLQKNPVLSPQYAKFSKQGIALPELELLLKETVKEYKIENIKIKMVRLNNDAQLEEKEKHIHDLLMTLETHDRHLIIANFNQGIFTGDADVGHYSPVAAYDSKSQKVLLLDTDRQWYEPYWVSEKVFLKGMKTIDTSGKENRGYIDLELPVSKL